MKKFFFFLSAIALLGLTTACVEQISSDNPNYNAEKGEVKTKFIINVATNVQTKASAADAQIPTTSGTTTTYPYRGMQNMKLFMSKGYAGNVAAYLPAPYQKDLANEDPLYDAANLDTQNAITAANSSRVYEMSIPTGVDNMVFYAKAKGETNNKTNFVIALDDNNKNISHFDLIPINDAATVFSSGDGETILAVLNSFTSLISDWSKTDDVTLATAFNNYFTTEETLRQASGPAVLRTMQDLYKLVKSAEVPTEGEPQTLAGKIKKAILGKFTADDEDVLAYNTSSLLNFPGNLPVGAAQVVCDWSEDTPSVPQLFKWVNPSNTILDDSITNGTSTTVIDNTIDYKNIMYPAELCYWADSPIRISNNEGVEENEDYYPVNWSDWNTATWSSNYGWLEWPANRAVTSATRAVALKNNVLYGTALAAATVKMKSQVTDNKFYDNRSNLVSGLQDKDYVIDGESKYFTVTGILIGGQPKRVEWNFVAPADQAGSTAPNRNGVIYDNIFSDHESKVITTTPSDPYYVMVFDNYNPSKTEVVYFALELENHIGDFYGKDNIIYDGGKFYLTGKLDLTSANTDELEDSLNSLVSDKKTYRIPPVKTDQANGVITDIEKAKRIFIQDFITNIDITIGEAALKHAYATIPDLRPIEMYFGLSVDLTWKAGASLSVEL